MALGGGGIACQVSVGDGGVGLEEGTLMTWWAQLTTVSHPDTHIRRRGRLLSLILLASLVLTTVFLPVSLFSPNPLMSISTVVACMVVIIACLWLARRGLVTAAGWLFVLTTIGAIALSVALGAPIVSVFFLVFAVLTASLVLPPVQSWWVLLVALGATAAAALVRPGAFRDLDSANALIYGALLLVASTVLAVLGARAMEHALLVAEANAREAAAARQRAEEQAHDLATQAEALRRTEEQLHLLVATLETPTVALADGVLLAPLIGSIDSRRAQTLTDRLLREIASQRVQLLILDIAEVTVIDTAVAHTLVQVAQAVRLLGCRVVLTGVAPAMALTLTHLGTNLGGMETARSPQEVLSALAPPGGASA